MAITASGLYGPTLVAALTNTAALDVSAEDLKVALVTDSYTPDFNSHTTYASLTNEVSGTGYVAGGATLTGTTLTASGGFVTYDANDVAWASPTTITNAMAAAIYHDAVGDQLLWLADFVNVASSSSGTFTVAWDPAGIFRFDNTP